jgi:hypothetical protein
MGSEYSIGTKVFGAMVGGATLISSMFFLCVLLWGK